MKKELSLLFLFVLSFGFVLAHLDGGQDISKNGYIIDIGYSPEHLHSGEQTEFAFNLVDETTKENIEFTSVWVRLIDENVVFSGEIRAEDSNAVMTYTFPKGGDYVLAVVYKNGENIVIDQEISLEVEGTVNSTIVVIGLLVVLCFIFLLLRRRK